jgi:CheY-like chemotaxis protein
MQREDNTTSSPSLRIAIADDEDLVGITLQMLLEHAGYSVTSFGN